MKRRTFLFGFLSFLALLVPAISTGNVIHIYPGTNVFGNAVGGLKPGDTLIVHQGTYTETQRNSITVRGTASQPVLIKGADGEARPIINMTVDQNVINLEGTASYITIQGLEFKTAVTGGLSGDGVRSDGSSNQDHITLYDLVIHDVAVGIGLHAPMTNLIIRKCHIYDTGINDTTGEGMYIGNHGGSPAITDSLIEQNWVGGIKSGSNSTGDGIEVKYKSIRNTIRDNVITNRPVNPAIFVYGTDAPGDINIIERNVVMDGNGEGILACADATVRNNIILNVKSGCLESYAVSPATTRRGLIIENNTVYCPNNTGLYLRWPSGTNVLANNAIYCPGGAALDTGGSLSGTARNNYLQGTTDVGIDNVKFYNGGTYQNAFVDAPNKDVWPKTGSILIGNANGSYVPTDDFNLYNRLAPYDVGAYETDNLTSNPGWTIQAGFKQTPGADTTPPTAPENLRVQ